MSFQAMAWATGLKLKCYEKLVLLMLASRADPDSNTCFPSMSKLAQDCGMSAVQARRAVAGLEKKGLVRRTAQIKSYGQTANLFTLKVGATPDLLDRPPDLIDRHKLLPLNRTPMSPSSPDSENIRESYRYIGTAKAKSVLN
jgi:DNA-binding transcriptional MocR family regulator